jgi:hypothetical protein
MSTNREKFEQHMAECSGCDENMVDLLTTPEECEKLAPQMDLEAAIEVARRIWRENYEERTR